MDHENNEKILIDNIWELIKNEGLLDYSNGSSLRKLNKQEIREMHSFQREQILHKEKEALLPIKNKLIQFFASGEDVCPNRIEPKLVKVNSQTQTGQLFRMASLLWSVPVSKGFGRRIRFLVIDNSNNKLIGIFALGDPVFNLAARDNWVGWTPDDRRDRLINVMDAYVVGAVPPYNRLLCGKLITSLIGSQEVSDLYTDKYEGKAGVISGKIKENKLALVTVTSALGRSSIYNRLKLPGFVELIKLGETKGYGHFHISKQLFDLMRELLVIKEHSYAMGYEYGCGPNWRIRVIRRALSYIGINNDILKHGISREVYGMPIALNWKEYLQGIDDHCVVSRPSVKQISDACLERWVIPRSKRVMDYKEWSQQDIKVLFDKLLCET